MMGKGLEKPGPVGAEISFRHARTIASLRAPSTRRESYHGWLNHPSSTKVAARPNCEVTQHRTLTLLPQQQIVCLTAEDLERALRELAESEIPFDTWYEMQMRKLFGCDFARLPRVARGERLFAWREAAVEEEKKEPS
jgi:hypothetical protein